MKPTVPISVSGAFVVIAMCLIPQAALAQAQSAPIVTTLAPDFITEQSAQMNARVFGGNVSDTQYWFEWNFFGRSDYYPLQRFSIGGAGGEVRWTLIGLAPETTYCYRVVAENSRGKDVGQIACFKTKALLQSVDPESRSITLTPTFVGETDARLRGYVAPHGTFTTEYWFEWGTTNMLGNTTPRLRMSQYSGYVEYPISGLIPGTLYYFRVVSENTAGKWRGAIVPFTTAGVAPSTVPAGGITGLSSGGSIVGGAPGTADIVEVFDPTTITATYVDPRFRWNVAGDIYGTFTIEYGPTKDLGRVAWSSATYSRGDIRYGFTNFPDGVYYRGVFSGGGKRIASAIKYAPGVNTGAVSRTPQSFTSQIIPPSDGPRAVGSTTPASAREAPAAVLPNPVAFIFGGKSVGTATGAPVKGGGAATANDLIVLSSVDGTQKPHEPIEYTIRYANETGEIITDTVLRVTFPKNVIYIGDNTNNEFFIEEDPGSKERTYVLPIGILRPGDGKTITILGMMTSDTSVRPFATSRITYKDAKGNEKVRIARSVTREDIARSERGTPMESQEQSTGAPAKNWFSRLFGGESAEREEPTVLSHVEETQEDGKSVVTRVRYVNATEKIFTDIVLRITLPDGVEYVSDDTGDKLVKETDPMTGATSYVYSIGTLRPGEEKTITIMGKKTNLYSSSSRTIAATRVEYTDTDGSRRVTEGSTVSRREDLANVQWHGAARGSSGSVSARGWRVFPTTPLGWVILVAFLGLAIIGGRKAYVWYIAKKKELEEEEKFWSEPSSRA